MLIFLSFLYLLFVGMINIPMMCFQNCMILGYSTYSILFPHVEKYFAIFHFTMFISSGWKPNGLTANVKKVCPKPLSC